MDNFIRNLLQKIYYRIYNPIWKSQYHPFIENVNIVNNLSFEFFYGTRQASSWYKPIKPHTIVEYVWVSENINIAKQNIVDAGAHHGHYSLFLASLNPNRITSVEPFPSNCVFLRINSELNKANLKIVQKAIAKTGGKSKFIPRGNGKLFNGIGIEVETTQLHTIDPNASVIKLDIEGTEFDIINTELEKLPNVKTWIIEIHHNSGNPKIIIDIFEKKGFMIFFVDKDENKVKPYTGNFSGNYSTTFFFSMNE